MSGDQETPKAAVVFEELTDAMRDVEWLRVAAEQRTAMEEQRQHVAEWRAALRWQSEVMLLSAEALVAIAPRDAGRRQTRLDALAETLPGRSA